MDKGTYTYPDGAKYEGEWQNNKRHGRGLWTRPDGMKYEGGWENDKPNGQGTLTLPNGNKRIGLWKEGKLISEQQPVEPKDNNFQELIVSQKARIQELEEANEKLKLEVSALKDKVASLEGKKGKSAFFEEEAFATPLGRTEEKPPLKEPVRGEKPVRKATKAWWVAVAVLLLVVIIIANSGGEDEPPLEVAEVEDTKPDLGEIVDETDGVEEESAAEAADEPEEDREPEPEPDSATLGEKNAVNSAKNYLNVMAFSYSGLVDQLKFEGFTHEEAVYGADNCEADWYEQAALKAETYLDLMAFSREGLIEQLEFDGFTRQQAEYGAQAVGY